MSLMCLVLVALSIVHCQGNIITAGKTRAEHSFPDDFLFGVSTAAFQIEGAWNIDGKSPSIWDTVVHNNKSFVRDGSNADVAADSYHNWRRDVQMIRELGVDIYRFSISWPRVLPTGFANEVNPLGIEYYRNLINELVKYKITPMVTIFHWDLPQKLQDIGGFSSPNIIDLYADYAKVLFDNFADKVKYWVTFNEPMQTCLEGYGGTYRAPQLNRHGIAEYLCAHHLIKAHAKVYKLFDKDYRHKNGGLIGIAMDSNWAEPRTESEADKEAVEIYLKTHLGWYAHPIYSQDGNYPPELISRVDAASRRQNYSRSRLPRLTRAEVDDIRGSADFFGLNHYTTYLLSMAQGSVGAVPSHENDVGIVRVQDPEWPSKSASKWLRVVPEGFRRLLRWISQTYGDVPIIVTENGYADLDGVHDDARVAYYSHYLNALLKAIHEDQVNVVGYLAWSLMDNFEWDDGYVSRFGLYYVDFESANRTRTAKDSAGLFSSVVASRRLPAHYDPADFSAFSSAHPKSFYLPLISSILLVRLL